MTTNLWRNFDSYVSDLAKFDKFFVGGDQWSKRLAETAELLASTASNSAYPPFNIKKTDTNKYVIEMAIAGFSKQDIELTLEDNKLIIKGQTTYEADDSNPLVQFLHKGIADRAFTRTFTLADNVVVNDASILNGLLKVWLEHIIPEHKKPKKIEVTETEQPITKTARIERK